MHTYINRRSLLIGSDWDEKMLKKERSPNVSYVYIYIYIYIDAYVWI